MITSTHRGTVLRNSSSLKEQQDVCVCVGKIRDWKTGKKGREALWESGGGRMRRGEKCWEKRGERRTRMYWWRGGVWRGVGRTRRWREEGCSRRHVSGWMGGGERVDAVSGWGGARPHMLISYHCTDACMYVAKNKLSSAWIVHITCESEPHRAAYIQGEWGMMKSTETSARTAPAVGVGRWWENLALQFNISECCLSLELLIKHHMNLFTARRAENAQLWHLRLRLSAGAQASTSEAVFQLKTK